ncbi:MAG: hypothetical protein FKY71_15465, partial [Spiribacter salinus]
MARIPDDEIRRIKAEVPIRSYLEGRGHAFRQHGADIVCPCPFPDHDDGTPSFIVSEAKNVYGKSQDSHSIATPRLVGPK